jgi:hypothetical protein
MSAIDWSLPVRSAHDMDVCRDCGEPWCELHEEHYADCPCPGPDSRNEDEDEGVGP